MITCVLHLVHMNFSGWTAASMHSLQINLFFPVLNVCFSVLCPFPVPRFPCVGSPKPSFIQIPSPGTCLLPCFQLDKSSTLRSQLLLTSSLWSSFPSFQYPCYLLGWTKKKNHLDFWILWKNWNEVFGQPNIEHFLYFLSFSKSCIHIASFNPIFFLVCMWHSHNYSHF